MSLSVFTDAIYNEIICYFQTREIPVSNLNKQPKVTKFVMHAAWVGDWMSSVGEHVNPEVVEVDNGNRQVHTVKSVHHTSMSRKDAA